MTKAKPPLDVYKQCFREYLRETDAVADEMELEQLMKLLHEPLPVSFRLNGHRPDAMRLKVVLATELQFPRDKYFYREIPVNPPKPIAWYPHKHVAWQMDCGRVALSKSAPKYPDIASFHSCLLEQTDRGNLCRQEAVSMLPVLFLDVQRGHRVLDMCASPGSKTTQILDFLLAPEDHPRPEPSGLVVANDCDKKRAYMLVHRLACHTLRRVVVTCGAGDTFPGLYDATTGTLQRTNVFDRVLCDVPCSGDGTLRKQQRLWKDWHIGHGLTLHPIQVALALRGAALVRVGGLVVYSTCSFNPVENEAVVAEVMRRANGALKLLDVSRTLPGLVARPGRSSWRVGWRSKSKSSHKGHVFQQEDRTSDGSAKLHQWFASYDAVPSDLRGTRVTRSMFPKEGTRETELHKTLRLIPIDQNSGGFFIAVWHKVADLPGPLGTQEGLEPRQEEPKRPPVDYVCKLCGQADHFFTTCDNYVPATTWAPCNASTTTKRMKSRLEKATKRETRYRAIPDDVWHHLRAFYGLCDDQLKDRLWCRGDAVATVDYVDHAISEACLRGKALNIVKTGLKVFTKVTDRGDTFYRPSDDSLGFVDTLFTTRCLDVALVDVYRLLEHAERHVPFTTLSREVQLVLEAMAVGPAVVRARAHAHVRLNVWVGHGALLPRVSKAKRGAIEAALQHACRA